MEESLKGRARLWLRSERALGLRALPIKLADAPATAAPSPSSAYQTPPARAAEPAPRRYSPPAAAPPAPRQPVAAPVPLAAQPSAIDMYSSPDTAFATPPLSREEKIRQLDLLRAEVAKCKQCRLWESRTQTVFGEGDPDAQLFFVGEGPGETEDQTGRPFVGRAGQKLDEMIGAMGLKREQVYIGNVVKSRPPGNRTPMPDEIAACSPFLVRQIEIVRPRVIVTLGVSATQFILQSKTSLGRVRGQWGQWRGIKVMPTYHPSYLLRYYTLETRKAVWSDLQKVMGELGLKGKGQ